MSEKITKENQEETSFPKYHRLSVFDFVDEHTVETLLGYVSDAVGIPVFVQEPMQREKFFDTQKFKKPQFCACLEEDPHHKHECRKFFTSSVHESVTYGRPYVGTCPYGVTFAFGPLILKRGACTAALVAGYASSPESSLSEDMISRLVGLGCGMDTEQLVESYAQVSEIETNKFHAIADLMCTVAEFIMKLVPLRQSNFEEFLNSDMAVARNLIHDFYQSKQENGETIPTFGPTQRLDGSEEAQLIQAVSLGQRSVAEIRLRDILDRLYVVYKDDSLALKGHVMELAVLISRAPLFQVSYNEGESFSLNYLSSVNPPKTQDYLILKNWILTVLSESLDIIERKQDYDIKARVIREVISHINTNLDKPLRVEDVALAVSFSAQHLARIFREEMGMTLSEYINQARVEEAKRLLRTSSYNISQIAERLNFYDSTYFAKVFKKRTGQSPLAYRSSVKQD